MFFDLNVPLPFPAFASTASSGGQGKKGKGKQKEQQSSLSAPENDIVPQCLYTAGQIAIIERRIDLLVHLGYTVIALNQTVQSKVDSRTHFNWIDGLLPKLKKRQGVMLLKRLTVVLDEESEKALGINPQNVPILNHYDILSLRPTTSSTFPLACINHSAPSPHTAHIISIPVTFPRLPFHLKHTLIRAALKNGAVFEIDYSGAIGQEGDRRNWWGGAREVVRVTKGKGILVSSGAEEDECLRAPRDVANLITLLGLAQNLSHDAVSQTPKSIILRAQSRKTYRSVLSEPKLIIPPGFSISNQSGVSSIDTEIESIENIATPTLADPRPTNQPVTTDASPALLSTAPGSLPNSGSREKGKKRPRDDGGRSSGASTPDLSGRPQKKKNRR